MGRPWDRLLDLGNGSPGQTRQTEGVEEQIVAVASPRFRPTQASRNQSDENGIFGNGRDDALSERRCREIRKDLFGSGVAAVAHVLDAVRALRSSKVRHTSVEDIEIPWDGKLSNLSLSR